MENDDCRIGGNRIYQKGEIPFSLRGRDFFNLALKSMNEEYENYLVDAIGNIKKALECQMDELILRLGYSENQLTKLNFPKKTSLLGEYGFIAPRILKKVNEKRNKLEHSNQPPEKEQIEDYLDVAEIFITLVEGLYNQIPVDASILSENGTNYNQLYFHFSLDKKELWIKDKWSIFDIGDIIESSNPLQLEEMQKLNESLEVFKLKFGSEDYFRVIKLYYRLIQISEK